MPQYQDLLNVGGEIRTKQGKKFKNPTELAEFLGIKADDIDWGQISEGTGYEGLVNVGGEIRTAEGKAFKDPTELAGALGVKPHELDFSKIAPQTPQTAPQQPISPLGEVISQKTEADPRQAIIDQLTKAFQDVTKGIGTVDYGARFKELKEEAGLGGISERIGTLDMEIDKTFNFLDDLSEDIKTRSQGELVTQAGLSRQEAVEKRDLIKDLDRLTRARGTEAGLFERGKEDILTQIGLEQAGQEDILSQLKTAKDILSELSPEEEPPSPLIDAIMNTPELFKDLTPSEKTKVIPDLFEKGFDFSKAEEEAPTPKPTPTPTGIPPTEVSTEIETLAQAYLKGETLGSIGATKKAQVLARAGEIQRDNQIKQLKDPDNLAGVIQEAMDSGDSIREIKQDLLELGLTPDDYIKGIKALQERTQNVEQSFFGRLFGR